MQRCTDWYVVIVDLPAENHDLWLSVPVEEDPEPESICYLNAQLPHDVLTADDILAPELKGPRTLHNSILIAIEPLDDSHELDSSDIHRQHQRPLRQARVAP